MRRFIAGAVCPRCRAMDRIVLEEEHPPGEEGVRRRRCVSCGHTDSMPVSRVVDPPRRFTRRHGEQDQPIPVRIVDPRAGGPADGD